MTAGPHEHPELVLELELQAVFRGVTDDERRRGAPRSVHGFAGPPADVQLLEIGRPDETRDDGPHHPLPDVGHVERVEGVLGARARAVWHDTTIAETAAEANP